MADLQLLSYDYCTLFVSLYLVFCKVSFSPMPFVKWVGRCVKHVYEYVWGSLGVKTMCDILWKQKHLLLFLLKSIMHQENQQAPFPHF